MNNTGRPACIMTESDFALTKSCSSPSTFRTKSEKVLAPLASSAGKKQD